MMRPIFLAIAIAIAITLAVPVAAMANGPSFDCAKAMQPVEHLICQSATLSALDAELADIYKKAINDSGANRNRLVDSQRKWILHRATACKVGQSDYQATIEKCLEHLYVARVAAIDAGNQQASAPLNDGSAEDDYGEFTYSFDAHNSGLKTTGTFEEIPYIAKLYERLISQDGVVKSEIERITRRLCYGEDASGCGSMHGPSNLNTVLLQYNRQGVGLSDALLRTFVTWTYKDRGQFTIPVLALDFEVHMKHTKVTTSLTGIGELADDDRLHHLDELPSPSGCIGCPTVDMPPQ
ncbi:MAG TPA: lysozyme inhibitor LprI family protein [Magnetospirillaceae bacterium]|jgi:uncharacterized protein